MPMCMHYFPTVLALILLYGAWPLLTVSIKGHARINLLFLASHSQRDLAAQDYRLPRSHNNVPQNMMYADNIMIA